MLYAYDDSESSSNGVIRLIGDREMSFSSAELPSSPMKVEPDTTPTSLTKADGSTEGSQHVRSHSAAGKKSSLAQFTDALYSMRSEREESTSSGGVLRPKQLAERSLSVSGDHGAGRSPVVKTRLRVVKSKPSDPVVAAWQNSLREQSRPMEKILIQGHKDSQCGFNGS